MVQKMSAFLILTLNEENEAYIRMRVHICKKIQLLYLGW